MIPPEIRKALDIASQLAEIASDWHLDEVEIDGEMVSIYDVKDKFDAALQWLDALPTTPQPSEQLREALAEYAHEAWSGWMRHMFSKGQTRQINMDGGTAMYWLMPAEMFHRWQRQMKTPYADLPESEKESDRLEADRIIEVWDRTPRETGRTEPPNLSGWYWWDGTLDGRRGRGLVNVNMPHHKSSIRTIWPAWCDGWFSAEEMPGQWYGPILPPWKEDEL